MVVFNLTMVDGNKDWVIDSGATRHIYKGEEVIYFGDSRSTLVLGKGKILLKFTFGKTFSLSNVLHVPKIKYNLVSIYIQRKIRIKVSF